MTSPQATPQPPPKLSDLVFLSDQANGGHNFSRVLSDLRRANLSIGNRLRSIRADAAFVVEVATALGSLPLVANERCGAWYVPPARKAASAYFKSTDGHAGQWKFSTRRLNLHLLGLIGRCDGCILVDSTRRGKTMPDALSKTVPIWCSVLNRALFPSEPAAHELFVPSSAVSDSERSQIEARMPDFVDAFRRLAIDLPALRQQLRKPLRPVWVTQGDYSADVLLPSGFHPVVCCTSSRRVAGTELSEAGYIQGAADDTEHWALGLTAPLFWAHADELLAAPEPDLPDLIASLVASAGAGGALSRKGGPELKQLTPFLFVAPLPVDEKDLPSGSCLVTLVPTVTEQSSWSRSKSRMDVGLGKSKVASRTLRDALPRICSFAAQFLGGADSKTEAVPPRIVVACESGKDLSVGVALALYCWCFDDGGGHARQADERATFTKALIRVKLGRIMMAMPEANPSRATLQSVNSFLMDWRK